MTVIGMHCTPTHNKHQRTTSTCSSSSSFSFSPRSTGHESPRHLRTPSPPTATTAISRVEPDFSFKTQPSQMARKKDTGSAPKGKLAVKLIEARHLSAPSAAARPYVVVSFDQNEFVSREPIHEQGEEATGVPVAKTDSGAITPGRVPTTPMREDLPPRPPPQQPPVQPGQTSTLGNGSAFTNGSNSAAIPAPQFQQPSLKLPESALGRSLQTNGGRTPPPAPSLTLASPPPADPMRLDDPTTPTAESGPSLSFGSSSGVMMTTDDQLSAYNPTWKHEVCFDVMNEKSVITVQIFDRSVEEECFLGLTEIRPKLVNGHTVDQWFK